MYSAFILFIVYTFSGVKTIFSAHSAVIYDIKMTLFHRCINIGNILFPLEKQSVSSQETNCFLFGYCRETT